MIAATILKQREWGNFVELRGGLEALKNTGVPLMEHVCPKTMV